MSGIARTGATGEGGMLPSLVAWSSSLSIDRAMLEEDLLGSAAHVTMLARTRLVDAKDAGALRAELLTMVIDARKGALALGVDGSHATSSDRGHDAMEEDVHMAVEVELARRLGSVAGWLHTARSRNDQVALDLRLYVRGVSAGLLAELASLITDIAARAERERAVLLPAYTHRQRAQPISAAFLLLSWCEPLLRAAEVVAFALDRGNLSPLGCGACSGTSLPIDRQLTARLLGFPGITANALDTVGDRDFALDFTWACARTQLALARLAADVIDLSTSEFGMIALGGAIAAGSSMMPQKRNPDVFELVRGKSARAIADVVALLTLVKGLPSGYNRDQQEDRAAIMTCGANARGAIDAVRGALPHIAFVPERCLAVLAGGETQATDLAEALVRAGLPFREAYRAVGELVRRTAEAGVPLAKVTEAPAQAVHPLLDAVRLASLDPRRAVEAKESAGGTGPRSVDAQLADVRARAEAYESKAARIPTLDAIARAIAAEPLE